MTVYGHQVVARLDSRFGTRPVRFHSNREYPAATLHPANAIIGGRELALFAQIDPRHGHGSDGEQGQKPSGEAYLRVPVHEWIRGKSANYTTPLVEMHVRCQVSASDRRAKCHAGKRFPEL